MFAGGRLRQYSPIRVGAELTSRSRVAAVTVKAGRNGELAFVTVQHELVVDGARVGTEEQDLVYRSEPDGAPPAGAPPAVAPPPGADAGCSGPWRADLATDPVLLFRFSALTHNPHRIHYDRPYTTEVEGYPDLVVHGPLLALLALELPRRHAPERTVRAFTYRLVRPAFVPSRLVADGGPTEHGAEVTVSARGSAPSLTATIDLDRPEGSL
jgi:3-methylfumaryl-CoA hydratase